MLKITVNFNSKQIIYRSNKNVLVCVYFVLIFTFNLVKVIIYKLRVYLYTIHFIIIYKNTNKLTVNQSLIMLYFFINELKI